ncbi:MAG: hypothetical protein K2Z81_17170, partial [Cyanobacteria bacterium]|nr:hypothetical protein [Cyanobacteriota bacterium]
MKSNRALQLILVSLAFCSVSPGQCATQYKNVDSVSGQAFELICQAGEQELSGGKTTSSEPVAKTELTDASSRTLVEKFGDETGPSKSKSEEAASDKTQKSETITGAKTSRKFEDTKSVKQAFDDLQAMFKNYYSDAKIKRTADNLHVEYKLHKYEFHRSGIRIAAPKLDGVLCDITVKPGRYSGKEVLPLQTNEPLYVILLLAPYSERDNCHLFTRLVFPPNC